MRVVAPHVRHRILAIGFGEIDGLARTACGYRVDAGELEALEGAEKCGRCYPGERETDVQQMTLDDVRARKGAIALCDEWMEENRKAVELVVHWARLDRDAGRRCSIGFYAELLRRPEYHLEATSSPYKLDNRIRSVLVRRIEELYPDLRECFTKRHSQADPIGVPNATPRAIGGEARH